MTPGLWTALAATAAALSVAAWSAPFPLARLRAAQRRRWRSGRGWGSRRGPRSSGHERSCRWAWVAAGAVLLGGVAGAAAGVVSGASVLAFLAPPILAAALLRRRATARERRAQQLQQAVLAMSDALVAELRAGRGPEAALRAAVGASPELGAPLGCAVSAARQGGDVPAVLLEAGSARGLESLRRLAACWRVATGAGAGLADALERVNDGLRGEAGLRREVQAQLASARATARVLAALPGLALLLGGGVGARPHEFLLHSRVGVVCLLTGLALTALGLAWTDAMARAAADAS